MASLFREFFQKAQNVKLDDRLTKQSMHKTILEKYTGYGLLTVKHGSRKWTGLCPTGPDGFIDYTRIDWKIPKLKYVRF